MTGNYVSLLKSWLYWKKEYYKRGKKIPVDLGEFRSRYGDTCPVCSDNIGVFLSEHIYCICLTLRKLSQPRDFQSGVTVKNIDTLVPLKTGDPAKSKDGASDLNRAVSFMKSWYEDPCKWILISGGCGSGKTHIASSVLGHFPRGICHFVTVSDFQRYLMQATNESRIESFVNHIAGAPILILDDFGAEHTTDYVINTLAGIINRRYAFPMHYPIVMTTNFSVDEFVGHQNVQVQRVASRMIDSANSKILFLSQQDYRIFGRSNP